MADDWGTRVKACSCLTKRALNPSLNRTHVRNMTHIGPRISHAYNAGVTHHMAASACARHMRVN